MCSIVLDNKKFIEQPRLLRGFSIIELMMVIMIISALTGLMSLIYQDYREKSYRSIAIAQASDLKKSIVAVVSDTSDSTLFAEDRVLRIALDGTITCSTGCAGLDLNSLFPGYQHQPGSDLRINLFSDESYQIYSGHCQALNNNDSRYLGWLLTDGDPIEANEFPVGPDIANCFSIVSG